MFTGKTKSGFEFEIEDERLDDYELLEKLCEIDKGNSSELTSAIADFLGEEQKEALKEHIRNKNGRISAKRMVGEFAEILNATKEGKNS